MFHKAALRGKTSQSAKWNPFYASTKLDTTRSARVVLQQNLSTWGRSQVIVEFCLGAGCGLSAIGQVLRINRHSTRERPSPIVAQAGLHLPEFWPCHPLARRGRDQVKQ